MKNKLWALYYGFKVGIPFKVATGFWKNNFNRTNSFKDELEVLCRYLGRERGRLGKDFTWDKAWRSFYAPYSEDYWDINGSTFLNGVLYVLRTENNPNVLDNKTLHGIWKRLGGVDGVEILAEIGSFTSPKDIDAETEYDQEELQREAYEEEKEVLEMDSSAIQEIEGSKSLGRPELDERPEVENFLLED